MEVWALCSKRRFAGVAAWKRMPQMRQGPARSGSSHLHLRDKVAQQTRLVGTICRRSSIQTALLGRQNMYTAESNVRQPT